MRLLSLICAMLVSTVASTLASAQEQANPESIEIGLSTDRVAITADFSGADLTIFGSLENADPLTSRQGRYDVVVVLEGPARPVLVWRKDRVLGIWINTISEMFLNVPVSYAVSTTRNIQDITGPETYRQLSLGTNYIYLEPAEKTEFPATIDEFSAALRDLKKSTNLYNERIGGVEFLSQNLFRATVTLAPNVPVGTHKARAFLFKSGIFIKETSAQLAIVKSGFEQSIFSASRDYGLLYGILAVLLAMVTGWLGRIIFRRD
jgi:uncharacterized protein (TIGR02186 family)